jgi:alginate O-acetyltransferase complex protein AlgI
VLFNSIFFIGVFLPSALGGYFVVARYGHIAARLWLIAASLIFYGWLTAAFIPLLVVSIGFNFAIARCLEATHERPARQAWMLRFAVGANLIALVYYKYLAWLVGVAAAAFGMRWPVPAIALPLGISFFTFTQLGYLMDVRDRAVERCAVADYTAFVTFFPHLIAGPILRSRTILPQLEDPATLRFSPQNLSVGLSIFIIGLFKKTLLADPTSVGVADAFAVPDGLPLFAAWDAALRYSLQLYFDFSGYSDMAIGLARMFNLRFPVNFNSPYKAKCVIDYWQRWHISLTNYFTQYLYNPVSLAIMRRRSASGMKTNHAAQCTPGGFTSMIAVPVFITIGLAGVWHGSGSQFLVFGLLHASYLTINRAWRLFRTAKGSPGGGGTFWRIALTYLCVLVGAVMFRAPSVASALSMLGGMAGLHGLGSGIPMPPSLVLRPGSSGHWLALHGLVQPADPRHLALACKEIAWLVILYGIVWGCPNTQQIFVAFDPVLEPVERSGRTWLLWRPDLRSALACGALATLGLLSLGGTSEFLYFKF